MPYWNFGLFLLMFLWFSAVFCKLFGFKQISHLSVKFSVNVNGNDFIAVDLDFITVEKKLCI